MELIFMQSFVTEVKLIIFNKVKAGYKEVVFKDANEILEITQYVEQELGLDQITAIRLIGRTKALKELQSYYNDLEGVDIIWQ